MRPTAPQPPTAPKPAVAILYAAAPVSATAQPAAVVMRDAEVVGAKLTGLDTDATADLLALGIVVR